MLRFIHGFSWGFITTGMVTVTIDIIPIEKRGQGIGYLGIAMTLAMALAPPVAIAASKYLSFNYLFFGTTVVALISFLFASTLKIKSHIVSSQKGSIVLFVKSALPVSISMMLFTIAYGSIMSFITLYALELNIKNAGRFFFFMALGLIITRLFSGKIFDKYGPRWISIGGFIIGISGFIFLSIVEEEMLFLVAALCIGLGFGSIVPAAQAMINNMVEPQRRGAANSTFLTFFDLGIGLGMVITGAISGTLGYRLNYLICAGISTLGLIIFIFWALKYYFNHQLVKTK
jgi:predicted MFS family arabinose efflux permease